jgi:hypothetical protein
MKELSEADISFSSVIKMTLLGAKSNLVICGAWVRNPSAQSILLWLFWRWDLVNCLPNLASNVDLLDLSLPSSLGLQATGTWLQGTSFVESDSHTDQAPQPSQQEYWA